MFNSGHSLCDACLQMLIDIQQHFIEIINDVASDNLKQYWFISLCGINQVIGWSFIKCWRVCSAGDINTSNAGSAYIRNSKFVFTEPADVLLPDVAW